MGLTLYYSEVSHPANAARLMLDYKGIDYHRRDIRAGFQAFVTRRNGFHDITVPALDLDGRRVQGSIPIARALEELRADPPLYPDDPERRRQVQEAEEWGERELQPVPRHLFRWALITRPEMMRYFVADLQRLRPAGLVARIEARPLARAVTASGTSEQRVRADLTALPAMLDRVQRLLDAGVLGTESLNAADFQIGTTLRAIDMFVDLRELIEGGPLDAYAHSVWPDADLDFPAMVPAPWMDRLRSARGSAAQLTLDPIA
jgi:glutathione S-transferase